MSKLRFPEGRASERVVNDILQIAEGIKSKAPIEMGPPLTEAVLVDKINMAPNMPSNTALQGAIIDSEVQEPVEAGPNPDGGDELPTGVARGQDLLDTV